MERNRLKVCEYTGGLTKKTNSNFNDMFYFMEWIFDGIGTEIISLLIGLAGGGAIGYRIGIRNKISQHQKGRDQAKQVQIGNIINNGNSKSRR